MSRILISGYYGFGNTGDEAVLSVLLDMLSKKYGREAIAVMSADPERTAQDHNIRTIDRRSLRLVVAAVGTCDILVSGGGGLLQDITSNRSLYYYLGIIALARAYGKKVIYFANGIGPIRKPLNRWLVGQVSKKIAAISVRDPESAEELISAGVDSCRITVTADPALLLRTAALSPLQIKLAKCGYNGSQKMIAVCPRVWNDFDKIADRLAKYSDYAIDNYGLQVLMIPFHFGPDLQACRKIAALMHNNPIVIDSRLTPEEIRALIGCCEFTLGMRLHSLILSAAAGIPMAGMSYDKKVAQFLFLTGQPELPGFFTDEDSDYDYNGVFDRLINEKENLKEQLSMRVPALTEKALLNELVLE